MSDTDVIVLHIHLVEVWEFLGDSPGGCVVKLAADYIVVCLLKESRVMLTMGLMMLFRLSAVKRAAAVSVNSYRLGVR